MFKNYIKVAFRNLWKNKVYSIINLSGLSVGLTVCLLIFLFIRYEISFDQFHQKRDRIYRVVTTWTYPDRMEYSQGIPFPLPEAMKEDFPGIDQVAPVLRNGSQITIQDSNGNRSNKFDESGNIFIVSPAFYTIFNFPWLEGDPATALKEPNTAAITKSLAEKYFGNWHDAMGKSMLIDNDVQVKVTGIMADIPENTDLPVKIAVSYSTAAKSLYPAWQFVTSDFNCYVRLKKSVKIENVKAELPGFIKKYYPDNNSQAEAWGFAFQPLKNIHFSTRYGSFGPRINPKELIALGIVALFVLAIACINFINMSTAQSGKRAKEVGVRKALGGRRRELALQFISETMMIAILSAIIACVLTGLALPAMRNFFGKPISFEWFTYPAIPAFIVGITLLTGLLAGAYPAWVLSGFSPVKVLKGKTKVSGGNALRKALVVVQFTVSVVILIALWIITKQMNFFRTQPMGFNREAISLVSLPDNSDGIAKYKAFKNKLSEIPGIRDMSLCYDAPSSLQLSTKYFSYNSTKREPFNLNMKYADTGYFKTFGLHLIAGRVFHPSDTMKEVVVNETLLRKLGINDPVNILGKYLLIDGKKATVTGVVKDFINYSMANKISPIAITTDNYTYGTLALKLSPQNMMATMKKVKDAFAQVFPNYIYHADFFDRQIANYYISQDRLARLFALFTGIVFLISFTGLLSLLSFITEQRTKEIAIRKVLGASLPDILSLIGKDFILLIIIANMIGFPIAYLLARKWLNGFAYSIPISIWPFVVTALLSIVLTILIISIQVVKSAGKNPVNALKYE